MIRRSLNGERVEDTVTTVERLFPGALLSLREFILGPDRTWWIPAEVKFEGVTDEASVLKIEFLEVEHYGARYRYQTMKWSRIQ